jgi:hypothetical protein
MNTYSPIDYIKIDIANQFGYDKKSFKQRIQWVDSVKDLRSKVDQAEKPAQYLAAVLALEDAMAGVPSGHLVGLDACSSGIAILGILAGCPVTSQNTGVIGSKRMDMYSECNRTMNDILGAEMTIPRSDTKQAQMTHFYGSKATPRAIFGDESDELMAFYQAQEIVAPGACYIMRELLDSWQPYALEHAHTLPDGYNSIVPVLQKMKAKIEIDELDHATLTYIYEDNIGTEKGLAVAANMTHAVDGFLVRETVRRCFYDKEKLTMVKALLHKNFNTPSSTTETPVIEQMAHNHGFLSLRGAEFITEENVLTFSIGYRRELFALIKEVMTYRPFPVITVHDEFKCHANHVNQMRNVYMTILAELADSNVGQQIIREVRGDNTYVLDKFTTNLGNAIMKSEYFLS